MLFFCSLVPLGLIIAAFFVADAIRYRERPHYRWSSSLVIGIVGTITSLSYRVCGQGEEWRFDEPSLTVATTYRGLPFAWWGWVGLKVVFAPGVYFFFDLLFWTLIAAAVSYLITLGQWYSQYSTREVTQIVTVSIVVAVAPVVVALLFGGIGC